MGESVAAAQSAYRRFAFFILCLTVCVVAASVLEPSGRQLHPTRLAFQSLAALLLGSAIVPLKAGRMSLLAIPLFTSVLTLSPAETALVALIGNVPRALKGRSHVPLWSVTLPSYWGSVGASAHQGFAAEGAMPLVSYGVPLLLTIAANLAAALFASSTLASSTPREVVRSTFDRTFLQAYTYFGVAALLSASLLDGSLAGWVRVAVFYLLSFALVQAISERRTGDALREQLQVIDERIVFGQEAEAALHAVKNQLALASLYLEDLAPTQLGRQGKEALRIVFNSMQQSADILRRTSAAGRSANAPVFVDANLVELAHSVVVLAQARAAQSAVQVNLVTKVRETLVYADPFLIREIITNLVHNSLEALAGSGHIQVMVGVRSDGSPYVQVVDDGPGLSDEAKRTIFASRESTKTASGAGIGLTLSLAIATQHGGRLSYDKRRRKGASFTLILPPRDAARVSLAAHSKTASAQPRMHQSHPGAALLPGS
jgi:signal transduction histidine kinase